MPTTQSKRQALREARARAARQRKIIQWVAIGVAAVAVLLIGWSLLSRPKQYDAPPPMTIDVNKQYFAVVQLKKGGEFTIQLFADKAPVTVNNFVFLSREGFYNGVTFHRVLEGFMAQTGDPTGTGMGGPGYQFEDEFNDLTFDRPGVVAMANSGPNSNGSQFFITFAPTEWLNGRHTIFGQVIEGMEVVYSITLRDPEENPDFEGDVIASITITEE